jgi:hypothetical protein
MGMMPLRLGKEAWFKVLIEKLKVRHFHDHPHQIDACVCNFDLGTPNDARMGMAISTWMQN